jgi:hypothetical protein
VEGDAHDVKLMRFRLPRLFTTIGVAAILLAATGGVAAAAPAAPARAATCVYYVKVFAYVCENPSQNSKILKSKGAFERFTGPCRSSNGFIAVYTSAASYGIGWIDRSKLF